jgi:hypothetical protein
MSVSTIEASPSLHADVPELAPAPRQADGRRKCDRVISLWHRHRDGEAIPRWSKAFMADAGELGEYCIVGSTDAKTAAVAVEDLGRHLRDHLKVGCADGAGAAARAAILLKEVVDAARWLDSGSRPRPVSQVYSDHNCPDQTVKSRFVVLPFADDRTGRMRWLALGDWCTSTVLNGSR